jgi:glycosyltransferase involved in cell wall biosynthesis
VRISVLVPTWRRPAALARCLDGLAAQGRPPSEVVVVVRSDDEASAEVVAARAHLPCAPRTVTLTRPGVVAAMNAGFESCTGDVVCVTDDDTVPRREWLERIAAHFEADLGLGGVGGRDFIHGLPGVDTEPRRLVGVVRPYGRLVGNHHLGVGGVRDVDVLKGANMAFRRAALEGVRADERLRGGGAQVHFEVAMCLAIKRAGWRLTYDPSVAVDHFPAARIGDDERLAPALPALANAVHNETYVLLRWLPAWKKPLAMAYGVLVGSRRAPGPLLALERMLRGEPSGAVLARAGVCTRARLSGVNTALSAARKEWAW